MCGFFFFFLFFFFFRKDSQKRGKQEAQRCPCSLAKALGGHLEMLLAVRWGGGRCAQSCAGLSFARSEEHTSGLQSPKDLVCRLLLEKKKKGKRSGEQKDSGPGSRESRRTPMSE